MLTPGISTGYWNARNRPSRARSSGSRSSRSRPLNVADPPVTSMPSRPASAPARVLLPEPLGPMMAWTSPEPTVRSIPFRICRSPAFACKPRISIIDSRPYPTLPSRLTLSSFWASTANSIGSSRKTSLQNPLTMRLTASSVERPRWRQ